MAYAGARFIKVLPELEMPGQAEAALAAYPDLGCVGKGYEVAPTWTILEDVFCAGNKEVYEVVENVLGEIMAHFPSEFIHVGGDACPKGALAELSPLPLSDAAKVARLRSRRVTMWQ